MKNYIKRLWLKIWPKMSVALFGVVVYLIATRLSEDLKALLVNIAATLISIPIIFIAYDLWNEKSRRMLNEYAYSHVGNKIYEVIDEVEDTIQLLMQGYTVYFREGFIVVDDLDPKTVHVSLTQYAKRIIYADRDEVYEDHSYSEDDYIRDMDSICEKEEYKGGIYTFDKATIVPYVSEIEYLGYQVYGLDLEEICERLNALLKNTFILERLDDEQVMMVLYVIDAVNALYAFIDRTENLFCRVVDREIQGFSLREEDAVENNRGRTGVYSLMFSDDGITLELDRNILVNVDKQSLRSIFVINPDHYIEFGDHITEVLEQLSKWKE